MRKGKSNETKSSQSDIAGASQVVAQAASDDLSIPTFLRREDTPEQREARGELTKRLRALRVIAPPDISPRAICEADQKAIAELSNGMAATRKAKAAARITKLLAKKSGDAAAMPLQGKEALKAIQQEANVPKAGPKEKALQEQRAKGDKRTKAEKLADALTASVAGSPVGFVAINGKDPVDLITETEPTPVSKASKPKVKEAKVRTKTDKGKSLANARKPVNGNGHSKVEIIAGLLKRKTGCTSKDVLDATGWPAVSMPQQAKAAGLKLRKVKESGEPTRYYGS